MLTFLFIGCVMGRMQNLDLTGKSFGKWIVLRKHENRTKHGEVLWECKCECGNNANVKAGNLRGNTSKSCGCAQHEYTHNMTGTKTFKSWESMKQRCLNKNAPDYISYGGRGIKVCNRWVNSFDNFLSDMGLRPNDKTLDRMDVNGDYTPENCRWATKQEQEQNKRNTLKITAFGETKTVHEWANQYNLAARVIIERVKVGWDSEKALVTPNRKSKLVSH
jgi:hypothetical protein